MQVLTLLSRGTACAVIFALLPMPALADADLAVVVVTASRSERPLEDAPAPIEVVSRKNMEARGVQSFEQAVNAATGVFVRPGRGGGNVQQSIMLHGVPEEKRSLVLLDGQPLNDAYGGGLNLTGLPVGMLDRVEVSQGPASALYGGNAMGGVVHYVTRLPKGPEATLRLGYGDAFRDGQAPANTRAVDFTVGDRLANGLALLVGLSGHATDGYGSEQVVTGAVPTAGISGAQPTTTTAGASAWLIGDKGDNRWSDQSLAVRAVLPTSNAGRVSAGLLRQKYDYDFGAPHTYLHNAAGAAVYTYGTVKQSDYNASYGAYLRDVWSLGLELAAGGGELAVGVSYANTPTNWYVSTGTTVATTITDGPGRITFGKSTSFGLDGRWTASAGLHTLTLGAEYKRDKASNEEMDLGNWKNAASLGASVSTTRGSAETVALFVQDEWRFENGTTVWAGLRWDDWRTFDGRTWNSLVAAPNNVAVAHPQRRATAVSPKLTLVHRYAPALAVRASVGQAFRPPNVYELYRIFKVASSTYMNNPQLTPETVTSGDLGIDARPWAGAKLSLNAFHNRFEDLIYTAGSGTLRNRVNAGLATSQGVQFKLEQAIGRGSKAFVNLTEQSSIVKSNSTRVDSVGKRMTWMPRRLVNLGGETRHGPWMLTGTVRHASRQYSTDNNSDIVTGVYGAYDGYTVADTRVAHRWSGGVELGFAIANLTDRKYFSNYLAAGRSWSVDLTLPF